MIGKSGFSGQNNRIPARKAETGCFSAAPRLADRTGLCDRGCHTALDYAVITSPDGRDPAMIEKLGAVAGRVLATD